MVVCRYFQQGNCRFGQSCRFDHIYGSKYTYHAANQQPQATQQPSVTDEQLLNQVHSDVQAILRGGQWILSTYAPYKEKPNIPGLCDLSPEEARLFIYEARANNTLEQAVNYMNNMFQEARSKYEQLLQVTPIMIKTFKSLYSGEIPAPPFTQSQNIASSGNNASSLFRGAVQDTSVFGANNSNVSAFGNTAARNVFGTAISNQAAQSIFSQATAQAFGNNQAQNTASSIFASASQNAFGSPIQQTSVFGQNPNTSPFSSSQSAGNVFQKPETQAQDLFAQANVQSSNSPFGQTTSSGFGQACPGPGFGQPQAAGNVFAQASKSAFGQSTQSNMFGQAMGNAFEQGNSLVYSKMEDLSEMELEAFKSPDFKLGFIPEVPPPQTLCY